MLSTSQKVALPASPWPGLVRCSYLSYISCSQKSGLCTEAAGQWGAAGGGAVFGESFGLAWAEQTVLCISYNLAEDFATLFLKTILAMLCPLIFICLKVFSFLAASCLSCSTWHLSSWREGFYLALEHRLNSPSACGILVP